MLSVLVYTRKSDNGVHREGFGGLNRIENNFRTKMKVHNTNNMYRVCCCTKACRKLSFCFTIFSANASFYFILYQTHRT